MRQTLRRAFFLVSVSVILSVSALQAHVVTWWGNSLGTNGTSPLTIYYQTGAFAIAEVEPESGEPCTVTVGVNDNPSSLISATVIGSGLNTVQIRIDVLRAPFGSSETATISGAWAATGYPPLNGCNGASTFTIPIKVVSTAPAWQLMPVGSSEYTGAVGVWIKPGFNSTLTRSSALDGKCYNIGVGSLFYVYNDMPIAIFERKTTLAGYLTGQVTDSKNTPLMGWKLDLLCGGLSATTDFNGLFTTSDRAPEGMNTMTASNPNGVVIAMDVPTKGNTVLDWLIEEDSDTNVVVATNVCNCTPWAAIGFGYLSSGMTPVYYSGGANTPKTGANCDDITVTVTPPSGPSITIMAGTNHHQNSGRRPASGTWTVTTTVCGKTKTASIDVP